MRVLHALDKQADEYETAPGRTLADYNSRSDLADSVVRVVSRATSANTSMAGADGRLPNYRIESTRTASSGRRRANLSVLAQPNRKAVAHYPLTCAAGAT